MAFSVGRGDGGMEQEKPQDAPSSEDDDDDDIWDMLTVDEMRRSTGEGGTVGSGRAMSGRIIAPIQELTNLLVILVIQKFGTLQVGEG